MNLLQMTALIRGNNGQGTYGISKCYESVVVAHLADNKESLSFYQRTGKH